MELRRGLAWFKATELLQRLSYSIAQCHSCSANTPPLPNAENHAKWSSFNQEHHCCLRSRDDRLLIQESGTLKKNPGFIVGLLASPQTISPPTPQRWSSGRIWLTDNLRERGLTESFNAKTYKIYANSGSLNQEHIMAFPPTRICPSGKEQELHHNLPVHRLNPTDTSEVELKKHSGCL